jgi:hypothetical protein
MDGCPHNITGKAFTNKQLIDNWHQIHVPHVGLSLGQYRTNKETGGIIQCASCRKGFNEEKGYQNIRSVARGHTSQ